MCEFYSSPTGCPRICVFAFNFLLFFLFPVILGATGPSEQFLKREGEVIVKEKMISLGIPEAVLPLFAAIASTEEIGHLGYHASSQDYRIYQDLIRFTIEEILGISIRGDFHFLRIPGDPDLHLETIDAFFSYWGIHINNKTSLRSKQLISLNYGIYSNYSVYGSSSALIFVMGNSHQNLSYSELLKPFYEELGIDTKELKILFKAAQNYLTKPGGILLGIRDISYYALGDTQCYPSRGRAFRWSKDLLSAQYACLMSEDYVTKKVTISPQITLIANTRYTLNPFSLLRIQRWDFYSEQEKEIYENSLRGMIRNLPRNSERVEKYKKKLLEVWFR